MTCRNSELSLELNGWGMVRSGAAVAASHAVVASSDATEAVELLASSGWISQSLGLLCRFEAAHPRLLAIVTAAAWLATTKASEDSLTRSTTYLSCLLDSAVIQPSYEAKMFGLAG